MVKQVSIGSVLHSRYVFSCTTVAHICSIPIVCLFHNSGYPLFVMIILPSRLMQTLSILASFIRLWSKCLELLAAWYHTRIRTRTNPSARTRKRQIAYSKVRRSLSANQRSAVNVLDREVPVLCSASGG
jgi:hypothetical protein